MNANDRKRLRAAVLRREAQERNSVNTINLGADIGNATTSIANADGALAFFPSFVAAINVRPYQGATRIKTDRHHISIDGINAIVGADAIDIYGHDTLMADAYSAQDAYKRYLEPSSLYALLAGISTAYPDADDLNVNLGTGAPLSIFEPHAEAIRTHYLRSFAYAYNGHARRVTFTDVQIYGEGMEALRLLPANLRTGNVAVHDLGGRTYNVILFKNGARRAEKTFDLGIDRLLGSIPSVSNDPGARWAIQSDMRTNKKAHTAIRQAMESATHQAIGQIERKVNLPAADRHVLLGGGAVYLKDVLKSKYGKPVIVLNDKAPEAANAIAYARAISGVM